MPSRRDPVPVEELIRRWRELGVSLARRSRDIEAENLTRALARRFSRDVSKSKGDE